MPADSRDDINSGVLGTVLGPQDQDWGPGRARPHTARDADSCIRPMTVLAKTASAAVRTLNASISSAFKALDELQQAIDATTTRVERHKAAKLAIIPAKLAALQQRSNQALQAALATTAAAPGILSIATARVEALRQLNTNVAQLHSGSCGTDLPKIMAADYAALLSVAQSGRDAPHTAASDALDDDALAHIFSYLGLSLLMRCGAVSREWHVTARAAAAERRVLRLRSGGPVGHGGNGLFYGGDEGEEAALDSFEKDNQDFERARYNAHLLCCLPSGNICVSVPSRSQLRIFSSEGILLRTIATRGGAKGITCDGTALFVVFSEVSCVQKLSLEGVPQLSFDAQKGRGVGQLRDPHAITLLDGMAYITDRSNGRVVALDSTTLEWRGSFGRPARFVQGEGHFTHAATDFVSPTGLATDGESLYISEYERRWLVSRAGYGSAGEWYAEKKTDKSVHRIRVFTPSGRHIRTIGSKGLEPGKFKCPHGLAIADKMLFVAEWSRVQVLNLQGLALQVLALPSLVAGLHTPNPSLMGIAVISTAGPKPGDREGHVFVSCEKSIHLLELVPRSERKA